MEDSEESLSFTSYSKVVFRLNKLKYKTTSQHFPCLLERSSCSQAKHKILGAACPDKSRRRSQLQWGLGLYFHIFLPLSPS